jgi:hypothetical protein
MVASRVEPGRASFDAARAAWAHTHGLLADDGLYLAEIASGPITLAQLVTSLQSCGKSRLDAIEPPERLDDAATISTAS